MNGDNGLISSADIITLTDSWATYFNHAYSCFGIKYPTPSYVVNGVATPITDMTVLNQNAYYNIRGSLDNISNIGYIGYAQSLYDNFCLSARADSHIISQFRQIISQLEQYILSSLPTNWLFMTSGRRVMDAYLTRMNATDPQCPAKPTVLPTLTAVPNGQIVCSGVGTSTAPPQVVFTYVSSLGDHLESLPSAAMTITSMGSGNSALAFTIAGNVPANVSKVRVYRTQTIATGANSTPYGWDQDVTVTAGGTFPTITCTQSDSSLRMDVPPPSFGGCLISPAAAAVIALTSANVPSATEELSLPIMNTYGMISPMNVFANSYGMFHGIGNTKSINGAYYYGGYDAGDFATGAVGLTTANIPSLCIQGVAGAFQMQYIPVNPVQPAGITISSINYTYIDSTLAIKSGALSPNAAISTVGSDIPITVPAGQLVQSITGVTLSALPTSGTFMLAPVPMRTSL